MAVDTLLKLFNAGSQHFSELCQCLAVDEEAFHFHLRQHLTQGQLHILVQLPHTQFFQTLAEGIMEGSNEGGVAQPCPQRHCQIGQRPEGSLFQILRSLGRLEVKVGHTQLFQIIAAVGGCQQVGRHRSIKHKSIRAQTLRQQGIHQGLNVMTCFFDLGTEKSTQELVVALQPVSQEHRRQSVLPLTVLHAHTVQVGQRKAGHILPASEQLQQFLHAGTVGNDLALAGSLKHCFVLCLTLTLRCSQAVLVNQFGELQLQKQLIECRPIDRLPLVLFCRKLDGRIGSDGGQIVGHSGALIALLQFLDNARLGRRTGSHLRCGHIGVEQVDGAIALHKGHRRLFSHALNTRDVVRGIAHQGLQVDDVNGIKAVLLPERFRCHIFGCGASHTGRHQLNGGLICDQLQGILVSGDHHRFPPLLAVHAGDGSQQVVRLPAIQLVHGDVHGRQHFLQNGHLAGQFLGHPLAGGLISLVSQVAEGRRLSVKGDTQRVRLHLIQQFVENIQKSKNGVGGLTVPGSQILADTIKRPVYDGISIQSHQFHNRFLPFCPHGTRLSNVMPV